MDFIPLAEESGLIVPIGEWVLRTACKQLVKWQNEGLSPIRVAVNVTTKQFRLYNFAEVIADILKETGLQAKFLELELTENIIINNLDIVKTIHDLKQMGVQIALDDFGTGYSSLNYLRHIPVDRIKIDQSFVQNIDSNRGDDVIIKAIIAMAKSLDLDVLAEGVETQDQLEFLKGQQCAEVQGYYYSKPVSTQDFEKLLRESSEKQAKASIETD
jgi:EAL domain-containing protein (putative c-di-GMP-specific phosphodiesterase class I)